MGYEKGSILGWRCTDCRGEVSNGRQLKPEDPTLIIKRGNCGGPIQGDCPGAVPLPDGRYGVRLVTACANVAHSGEWTESAVITRCPVAAVVYDPAVSALLQAAHWTEGRGSLSDIVENPTAGLLAGVQALRSEFSLIKRRTQEAMISDARSASKSQR